MKTPDQIDQEIKELENKIEFLKKEKESQSFEAGDWFVVKENGGCYNFKAGGIYEIARIEGRVLVARFNEVGSDSLRYNPDYARKATESEIEAHLIKLAEESGLKVGGKVPNRSFLIEKFKLCSGNSSGSSNRYKKQYNLKYHLNISFLNNSCRVPFDHITYQQSKFQHRIVINGYTAEFHLGYVLFGCAKFDNAIFIEAQKFINFVRDETKKNSNEENFRTTRFVTNIKLGQGTFTPDDIDNIVKQLKS